MSDLIQELEQAFQMLSTIPVCGDAVDRMARARAHLVNAFRIEEALNAREQAAKTRSGVDGFSAPEGPENGARSRSGLDAVAEGMKRDNEEARSDPKGAPAQTQRSGLRGERRGSESEGYGACPDEAEIGEDGHEAARAAVQ